MHSINLQLPDTWQSLTDKQLRFVFRLLAADHTSAQVKTLFLLRFGNIRVITRKGAVYICKRGKERFTLSSLQIAEVLSHLNWLEGILPTRCVCHTSDGTALYLLSCRKCHSPPSFFLITCIKAICIRRTATFWCRWHSSSMMLRVSDSPMM